MGRRQARTRSFRLEYMNERTQQCVSGCPCNLQINLNRLNSTMMQTTRMLTNARNPSQKFTSPPNSTSSGNVRQGWDEWEDKLNTQDDWTTEDKANVQVYWTSEMLLLRGLPARANLMTLTRFTKRKRRLGSIRTTRTTNIHHL